MTIRIHLDTDIGGDTDDLCALALLLGSPEVEIVGITTCADAEGRRKSFAQHALRMTGRVSVPVATGARGFLGGFEHFPGVQDARYWPGVDDVSPGPVSTALELLEANARMGATIVAIGPFTNLAILETLRPGAFQDARVVVMGGYLGKPPGGYPQWPASSDYNIQADRVAARIVFEKLDPLIASLNVTIGTSLRRRDLPALRAGGPLARLMATQAELHAADHDMASVAAENPSLAPDMLNFQYDSLACAAAIGLKCLSIGVEARSVELRGESLVLALNPAGPERKFVTSVDSDAMALEWLNRVTLL